MFFKFFIGNGLDKDVFKILVIIDCIIVVDVFCYDIKKCLCLLKII